MQTRTLGNTGLIVSRIGLGLAALGRPGYINLGHADDLKQEYDPASMQGHAHAVLDAAWRGGIRYFDAARSYGRAEEFLATWLTSRAIPQDAVTVGSKWGYTYTAGWKVQADKHEVKDHSLPVLQRQVAESRGLLGSYLALYQVHSATLESGLLRNQPVLEELARLQDQGLHMGVTLSGPQQSETLHRAMEVTVGGKRVFECVQATWNLLERSAGPPLAAAHEAGMGVIIKEALANGRLTERNSDPEFSAKRALLVAVAEGLQTTGDALSLAAVLAQPWADIVLSGAATEGQLKSNLTAQNVPWDERLEGSLRSLAEEPEVYWATRSGLRWN